MLIDGDADDEDLAVAARLAARYSQGREAAQVRVEVAERGKSPRAMDVVPLTADEIPASWYI